MSTSSEHIRSSGPLDGSRIDQLVAGDLPEDERRALLVLLDSEPDGWRKCALAFLEAQMWHEAFAPLGAGANADRPAPAPVLGASAATPWRRLSRWSALAACIAAAFALGWAAKQRPLPEAPPNQAQVAVADTPSKAEESPMELIAPPVEFTKTTERGEADALLESVVASWERQGYLAERQKKLFKLKLEDGQEREIQAQEVRLRFVGDRTY